MINNHGSLASSKKNDKSSKSTKTTNDTTEANSNVSSVSSSSSNTVTTTPPPSNKVKSDEDKLKEVLRDAKVSFILKWVIETIYYLKYKYNQIFTYNKV